MSTRLYWFWGAAAFADLAGEGDVPLIGDLLGLCLTAACISSSAFCPRLFALLGEVVFLVPGFSGDNEL